MTKDPIEGFHFTGYDAATKTLTIEIHPSILRHAPSQAALETKAIEIMGVPGVNNVIFIPRPSTQP
jgi:hypothetical protein